MTTHAPTLLDLRSLALDGGELQQVWERLDGLASQHARLAAETASAVHALREICEQRFGSEKLAPLFEDVSEKAPWLQDQAARFAQEHESLRARLVSLGRCSQRQLPLARCWEEFFEELRFFKLQLTEHESAECDFWQQVYGTDVGTKD
jgi:hypothetical protein